MKLEAGQHISVLGTTGSGKTFFVRNAILPVYDRVLVVDSEDYDFPDFPAVSVPKALRLAKSDYSFYVRVVVAPSETDKLSDLCRGLLAGGHDLAVYIDEITDWTTPTTIPDDLRNLIRKARKRYISVIVGTQRPQFLNKAFLSNSTHRFYFYISDYDRAAIRDYAPWMEERCGEIPYGSWRCLYQAPDGGLTLVAPATPYSWTQRGKRK